MVLWLLDHGAEVNPVDRFKRTPLEVRSCPVVWPTKDNGACYQTVGLRATESTNFDLRSVFPQHARHLDYQRAATHAHIPWYTLPRPPSLHLFVSCATIQPPTPPLAVAVHMNTIGQYHYA